MNVLSAPVVRIRVDGVECPDEELADLVDLRVHQVLSFPALCELRFVGGRVAEATPARFRPDAQLAVRLEGAAPALFEGEITGVEVSYGPDGAQEVHVRGYDALHRLRMRQAAQVYTDVTVADLAGTVAGRAGLRTVTIRNGPRWPLLVQHRQTDLDLLAETAHACGLYLSLHDGALHLAPLAGLDETVDLRWESALLELQLERNSAAGAHAVTAYGWDPAQGRAYEGQAGGAVQDLATYLMLDAVTPAAEHADTLARARLERHTAHATVVRAVTMGHPALRPGIRVRLPEATGPDRGPFGLSQVTHTVTGSRGYICELTSRPPALPVRAQGSVATLGMVTEVENRRRRARVRVKLPAFGHVQTGWMQVLMPGAGGGKGFIALPDRDDRVLVLLTDGNPAHGIVLGGLYGADPMPDSGVSGSRVRRHTWVTPGGQRIQLDDDRAMIRLENGDGSYVELRGGAIVIGGKSIDFRRT